MTRRLAVRLRAGRLARRRFAKRWRRRVLKLVLILALAPVLWVGVYRWIDPPTTYLIVAEWSRLGEVAREWRDLDEMSPHLPRAAMAGEDARFCDHWGFDVEEIRNALADKDRRRGASTITQQVAKNVFLWPDASWLRKGMEAGFTILIEALWPKRRIIEVYLNVAETGIGTFGAEAGAARYFGENARDLTLREASLIVAALPNPKVRDPKRPSAFMNRRAAAIADGAETLRRSGGADCLDHG